MWVFYILKIICHHSQDYNSLHVDCIVSYITRAAMLIKKELKDFNKLLHKNAL